MPAPSAPLPSSDDALRARIAHRRRADRVTWIAVAIATAVAIALAVWIGSLPAR